MKGKTTFRHAGILVKDLNSAEKTYQGIGFSSLGREKLEVLKMSDKNGNIIELVQGNWHDHLCVNFYEIEDGGYLEVFHHDCKGGDAVCPITPSR